MHAYMYVLGSYVCMYYVCMHICMYVYICIRWECIMSTNSAMYNVMPKA